MTTQTFDDQALTRVWDVMNRTNGIPAVESSLLHLDRKSQDAAVPDILRSPLGIDTNVLIRISQRRASDVIDYLAARHSGPLLLPGQVIQEVWNNFDGFTRSFAKELEKSTEALTQLLESSDVVSFESELLAVRDAVAAFAEVHPGTRTRESYAHLEAAFEMLNSRAVTRFVPRVEFMQLGDLRYRSRTPPGFKDGGQLGDFFVWCDYLYGLASCDVDGKALDTVVFVTNDRKKDWQVDGRPHPILSSEVKQLVGGELLLWTLDDLEQYVRSPSLRSSH